MITNNCTSDDDILKIIFYDLLDSYNININNDYKFIYDEFFDHLISDVNNSTIKNYRENTYTTLIEYKKTILRNFLYKHLISKEWFDKIKQPESVISLRRIVRKNKLGKITNERR